MHDAAKESFTRGVSCVFEVHGFRQTSTRLDSLDGQLSA
jgi:hypothetical protein